MLSETLQKEYSAAESMTFVPVINPLLINGRERGHVRKKRRQMERELKYEIIKERSAHGRLCLRRITLRKLNDVRGIVGERKTPGSLTDMATAGRRTLLLLFVAVLSFGVPAFCVHSSGECFFNTKGSCEYNGQVYNMGENWITSDCFQCVCMEPFGVGCCDQGSKPVDYPDWCEIIRRPDSCTSVAVMRANHKLPCLWGRGRLRTATGQPWKSDNDPLF